MFFEGYQGVYTLIGVVVVVAAILLVFVKIVK